VRRWYGSIRDVVLEWMQTSWIPDLPVLLPGDLEDQIVLVVPVNVESIVAPPPGVQINRHAMMKQTLEAGTKIPKRCTRFFATIEDQRSPLRQFVDEFGAVHPAAVQIAVGCNLRSAPVQDQAFFIEPMLFERFIQKLPGVQMTEFTRLSRNVQKIAGPILAEKVFRSERRENVVQHGGR